MSLGLTKKGERRVSQKSLSAGWRKVLELGEQLVALSQGFQPDEANHYNKSTDPGGILAQRIFIIRNVAEMWDCSAELWLPRWLGEETGYIKKTFSNLEEPNDLAINIFSASPPEGLVAEAVNERQTIYIVSEASPKIYHDNNLSDKKAGLRQVKTLPGKRIAGRVIAAAFPLMSPVKAESEDQGILLGVLSVHRSAEHPFAGGELELLEGLAAQAAIALQYGRQIAVERWRNEQLSLIAEVSKAVVSILDLSNLLDEVVNLIQERFGYPFVHLFSVHPGRRKIFFEAGSGLRSETLAKEGFSFNLDDPEGIIPWVARSGETILANDVRAEPRYRPSPIFPEETQAELTIPLKFGQEVLGLLDIQSNQVNEFDAEQVLLFEALADSIAIAFHNASLYRSEQWRRRVAESMREVAGMLSAEVGLDHILTAILAELEENLPCEVAAIWFLEEETQDQDSSFPPLRLAAVRGSEGVWLEPQIGLNMEDILEPIAGEQNRYVDLLPPVWILEALNQAQPVTRITDGTNDWFGIAFDFPADYSAVASPLRVGGRKIGLLTLAHHTSGRYGSEARSMTEAFASYASVAIQNARLYESTQEQVWISTVLLQTADATQATTTLEELLDTVVHITPMLGGVKECAVYLLGEDETFIPAASSGLTPEAQVEFDRRHYSPGDVPAFDRLRKEMQATIIQRVGDDCRVAELFPPPAEKSGLLELIVLVPLQARGELLGALLVHHTTDTRKSPVQALDTFFGERLPIIQGIAHQAGLALDNIQLIKSQKEEAYISVALLQVANAIVSANNLQEALGSIVRITPILTGVKRVAIYLLDQKTGQLSLAEAYGLPREAGIFTYELSEFPLVQAALERETLIAHPLASVMDDEWEDVPEVWTYLPAPEPEDVEAYLENRERLLLVLPLVIKNERLGAMIIEEPDSPPHQEKPGAATNQHLRLKRLEIATGISQQSALAIQNERLQQETVERERLEREMQLARQIQQTFLPDELPALEGWEINLWWRTAREVGGDFFDLFLLPSGELGLVIADVADKGMGAAMYMILIRTLIRANILESRSPAEVLERVNQLLLPDAHQGMFVTLFYGVLDAQSGLFRYANAGHNPPLWIRREVCEIELLSRSGMALGVVGENEIEEKEIALLPGDFLILYTDGVTDAMNAESMIYGSERLHQVVWEAAFGDHSSSEISADFMLKKIDASISDFVESTPVVDDSTVLVLYRQVGD